MGINITDGGRREADAGAKPAEGAPFAHNLPQESAHPAVAGLRGRVVRASALSLALVFPLILGQPGGATTLKDLQVGLRTLAFISPPIRGEVEVGIIHDSHDGASQDDARQIAQWLQAGAISRQVTFVPHLVDVGQLKGASAYRVAIVAGHIPEAFQSIQYYAVRSGTVTIGADLACVHAHACIVGVTTAARTEIVISRQASQSCGVHFLEAFRMMVTEY